MLRPTSSFTAPTFLSFPSSTNLSRLAWSSGLLAAGLGEGGAEAEAEEGGGMGREGVCTQSEPRP